MPSASSTDVGHRAQRVELALHLVAVLGAARLRQREADELDRGQLGQEGLGRRDPDLGPRVRVEHRVGLARDLRAVGVADRQHLGALLAVACRTASRGVGRLARLADRHDQRLPVEDGVAVAELGGHLDLDRDPRPVLDDLLADQRRVVGGAARDHEHLVDVAQLLLVEALLVEHDAHPPSRWPRSVSATAAGCSAISLSMKYS